MIKQKHNAGNNVLIKGEAIGLLSGLSFALMSALMISALVLYEKLPLKAVGVAVAGSLFVSAFIGNVITARIVKKNALINGLIFAGLYVFVLLILNVILFSIPTSKLLISVVAIVSGAMTVCVNNIIPKKNRGYKKMHHG